MRRLLLYFSYTGTNYRGLQLTGSRLRDSKNAIIPDFLSVQGILEHGLRKILRSGDVEVVNSSRTDSGVHALCSAVTFDVNEADFHRIPFSPEKICQSLNLFLEKNETDIRAKRVVEVPQDFFCRRAHSRTYLYRIAVSKFNDFENCPSANRLSGALPLPELNRCQAVAQPFDVQGVQEACKLFVGTWDFRTFMKTGRDRKDKDVDEGVFVKTIYKFCFARRRIEDNDFEDYYAQDDDYRKFDMYDFVVEGSGFLRRQVRRMIGTLLGLGQGKLEPKDILFMLQNPSEKSWNPRCQGALPDGLYLKSVNYRDPVILRGYLS